jgi:hypothetical protein
MQAEAYPLLIGRQMAAGRPVEALALAAAAPEDVRNAKSPEALAAVLSYLKSDPPPPVPARLQAWDSYLAYLRKTTGSSGMPSEIFVTYARDCRAEVDLRLAEASRARGKEARDDALDWARFYAGVLPDNEALLKRIAAAARPAAR